MLAAYSGANRLSKGNNKKCLLVMSLNIDKSIVMYYNQYTNTLTEHLDFMPDDSDGIERA